MIDESSVSLSVWEVNTAGASECQEETCRRASLRTAALVELERQHVQSQVASNTYASDESLRTREERARHSSADVEKVTGKYWEKRKAVASGQAAYDEASWTRLWEVSDKMVGAKATAG